MGTDSSLLYHLGTVDLGDQHRRGIDEIVSKCIPISCHRLAVTAPIWIYHKNLLNCEQQIKHFRVLPRRKKFDERIFAAFEDLLFEIGFIERRRAHRRQTKPEQNQRNAEQLSRAN